MKKIDFFDMDMNIKFNTFDESLQVGKEYDGKIFGLPTCKVIITVIEYDSRFGGHYYICEAKVYK